MLLGCLPFEPVGGGDCVDHVDNSDISFVDDAFGDADDDNCDGHDDNVDYKDVYGNDDDTDDYDNRDGYKCIAIEMLLMMTMR